MGILRQIAGETGQQALEMNAAVCHYAPETAILPVERDFSVIYCARTPVVMPIRLGYADPPSRRLEGEDESRIIPPAMGGMAKAGWARRAARHTVAGWARDGGDG
jgi:hypothetical protein